MEIDAARTRMQSLLTRRAVALRQRYVSDGVSDAEVSRQFRRHLAVGSVPSAGWRRARNVAVLCACVAVVLAVLVYRGDALARVVLGTRHCLVDNNVFVQEMMRPLTECTPCAGVKQVPVLENITREEFVEKYAYTGVPVVIKGATTNWTALEKFSLFYLRDLYRSVEGSLANHREECQFMGYATEYDTLADAFNMTQARAELREGEKSWYIGWGNCDEHMAELLRQHYQRPYFLPENAETNTVDWIFMGWSGPGAHIHLDTIARVSWQAQVSGRKTWTLIPVPECESVCHSMKVTLNKGDIIVVNTNEWYHATQIHTGDISIAIGSEYD